MRYIVLSVLLVLWFGAGSAAAQGFRVRVQAEGNGCTGSSVVLLATATGGTGQIVYEWRKVGVIHDKSVSGSRRFDIEAVSVTDTGRYYCVATDGAGLKAMSDTTAIRGGGPVVTIPELLITSESELITLTALGDDSLPLPAPAVTWSVQMGKGWQPAGNTIANPGRFTVGKEDIFIRVSYKEGNCVGRDSSRVLVKTKNSYYSWQDDGFARVSLAFRVTIDVPESYCDNEPLVLKAVAKGDAGNNSYRYAWYKVGVHDRLVSKQQEFHLLHAQPGDAGDYYCLVTDMNGFSVKSEVKKLVYQPIYVELPDLLIASEGQQLTLTALDTAGVEMSRDSLSWYTGNLYGNGTLVSGKMNPYVFQAASKDMLVKVVFTNRKGCTATDSLPVYVRASNTFRGGAEDGFARCGSNFEVVVDPPKIREFCENDRMDFRATVEGKTDGYTFRWWKVGRPTNRLVGEGASFSISHTLLSDAGFYFCTARDGNGFTASSDTISLTPRRVVLPEAIYATANELFAVTALTGKGDTVRSGLAWEKRVGNGAWVPVGAGRNPEKLSSLSDLSVRVICNLGGCQSTDTVPVYIKNSVSFAGNADDGYARTLIPLMIVENLSPRQLCTTKDSVNLHIKASGSDVKYEWQLRNKTTGLFEKVALRGARGISERELVMTNLRNGATGEFTGEFRCRVSSGESVLYSDTLKLYANHQLAMKVDRDTVTIYDGQSQKIEAKLLSGVKPWLYIYQTPFGEFMGGDSLRVQADSFPVNLAGTYKIISLCDSLGCEVTDGLPEIDVSTPEIPKIKVELQSDPRICAGKDVYLKLTVRDGIGPWNVWLDANGTAATEMGITWPLTMYKRDTIINFTTENSASYTVSKLIDLNRGQGEWIGRIEGTAAVVNVLETDLVRFRALEDNHVGICQAVELMEMLQPQLDGVRLTGGTFRVDGASVGDTWSAPAMTVGEHKIIYFYTNAYGCVSTADVNLVVDALPSVTVALPEDVCSNSQAEYVVTSAGNKVVFDLNRKRVDRHSSAGLSSSVISVDTYRETVVFLSEDSCLIYKITNVRDKFGCRSVRTDWEHKVNNRSLPILRFESRYPNDETASWTPVNDTVWTFGGAVGVKALLSAGSVPFVLYAKDGEVSSQGNARQVRCDVAGTGDYTFTVSDRYCRNNEPEWLHIRQQRPGFVRLKLFLEDYSEGRVKTRNSGVVFVELRKNSGEIVTTDTCQVLADGTVVDRDGNSTIRFRNYTIKNEPEKLFVVIKHPGYLPVMSKRDYLITDDKTKAVLIDFTDGNNIYMTGTDLSDHMTKLGERDGKEVWALSAIDKIRNELISVKDGNDVLRRTGDENTLQMTRKNRHKYSEVKE